MAQGQADGKGVREGWGGEREGEMRERGTAACAGSWFEVGGPQVARTDNTRRLPRTESLAASASVSAKIFSHFPPLPSRCCSLPLVHRAVLSGRSIHAARYIHRIASDPTTYFPSSDRLLLSLYLPFSSPPFSFLSFPFSPFRARRVSRDTSLLPFLLSRTVSSYLRIFFLSLFPPTCSTGRMHRERRAFAALERAQIRVRRNTNCSDRRSHIFSTAPEACRGRRSTRIEIETRGPPGRRARDRKGDQRWRWQWWEKERKRREKHSALIG